MGRTRAGANAGVGANRLQRRDVSVILPVVLGVDVAQQPQHAAEVRHGLLLKER